MTESHKVILDTDPGIDDAMAMLYLNACENLELLGITTTLGNASIENCTNNTLFLCEKFGIDAPVYRGANQGINGEVPKDYPYFVHGINGLGDLTIKNTKKSVEKSDAANFLLESAQDNSGEITIIAIGRLTNIALAISKDPMFANRVHQIIFMGGAARCNGNVTTWAEANIIGDPEAASIVFNSKIPLIMVGLDVTMQTKMSKLFLRTLTAKLQTLKKFLLAINTVYSGYYKEREGWDEFPVHDSSAIAYASNPEIFDTEEGLLNCLLEGEQRGRTVFTAGISGHHKVCLSVNSHAVLDDFFTKVTAAYG
jgi:inosine-uridine nucleoside N-ribohydrolase